MLSIMDFNVAMLAAQFVSEHELGSFFMSHKLNYIRKFTYDGMCSFNSPIIRYFPNMKITYAYCLKSTDLNNFNLDNLIQIVVNECISSFHFVGCHSLQILKISWCTKIGTLDGFGELKNLRHLALKECRELYDISDLKFCTKLRSIKLVTDICNTTLRSIESLGACKKLRRIVLGKMYNLIDISPLRSCPALTFVKLPGNFYDFSCFDGHAKLHTLDLSTCQFDALLNLDACSSLLKLKLYDCSNLNECFTSITCGNLKTLILIGCEEIENTDFLRTFYNLEELHIEWCEELYKVNICGSSNVRSVKLVHCDKLILIEIGSFVENLDIQNCDNLDNIYGCDGVCTLKMWYCGYEWSDREVQDWKNLRDVQIGGCNNLENFSFLLGARNLVDFGVHVCDGVCDISFLEKCVYLTKFRMSGCLNIYDISCLKGLDRLDLVDIWDCDGLTDVSCLRKCCLKELRLINCPNITDVSFLGEMRLTKLTFCDCGTSIIPQTLNSDCVVKLKRFWFSD